jgi:hypothetical protein
MHDFAAGYECHPPMRLPAKTAIKKAVKTSCRKSMNYAAKVHEILEISIFSFPIRENLRYLRHLRAPKPKIFYTVLQ